MKTLLLLASLVLVGTAGAEESCGGITTAEGITAIEGARRYRAQHECMMGLAERQNVTGSGTGQVTYPAEQTACEQKMQAAMDAMEPFVVVDTQANIMIVDQHGDYALSPESYWSGITAEAAPRRILALGQWESVKRECWRNP